MNRALLPHGRGQRGFTLVELSVVVAMIGILAALAGPRVTEAVQQKRADTQLSEVREYLTLARNRARKSLCVQHVTIHSTYLEIGPDPSGSDPNCRGLDVINYPDPSSGGWRLLELSAPTVSGATQAYLRFNDQGGTDYDAHAQITVRKIPGDQTKVFEIWPAVGTLVEAE